MKKRVLVGMTALLLSLSLLMAQEIPAGVITAFKRGSSQELSKYMGGKVNLVLQGRSTKGRKSTRLNSSHREKSRMPSSA